MFTSQNMFQPAGGTSSSKKVKKTLKTNQNHHRQRLQQPDADESMSSTIRVAEPTLQNHQGLPAPLPEGSTLISQVVTPAGWLTQHIRRVSGRTCWRFRSPLGNWFHSWPSAFRAGLC